MSFNHMSEISDVKSEKTPLEAALKRDAFILIALDQCKNDAAHMESGAIRLIRRISARLGGNDICRGS